MSTSDFDKHKVDHLFLLIGENPLPNYVAARLLLKRGGTPYLVHTTGTAIQAERLKRILDNEDNELLGLTNAQVVSLNDYESDAYHIQDEIRRKTESLKTGRLGMNYTGGTKAMAVHAYRALFQLNRPDTVFSYLDPRRLEICIDRENGDRIRMKVKKFHLEVELVKVFQLHGWDLSSEPTYEPKLPKAARAFAKFHVDAEAGRVWRDWCNDVLREKTRDAKNRWLEEKKLRDVPALSLKMLQSQEGIKNALEYLKVSGEELLLQTIKEKGLEKLKHACEWLDGEWLEHYVLQQVKELAGEWSIHESATSFWIKDPSTPKDNKFQFDVAFMRSYQLFAISCTTIDHKNECKQKLFEAYVRAQQLGGTEARIALVCCASQKDVNALQTEIVNVLKAEPGTALKDYKIAVFGRDDLCDISSGIAEWIDQNERETR